VLISSMTDLIHSTNSKISGSLHMTKRILLDCTQENLDFKTRTFILAKDLKCLQIIQNKITFSYHLSWFQLGQSLSSSQ